MERSCVRKFWITILVLSVAMLLGVFTGCKQPPETDKHVVSAQINIVDDIYHEVYIEEGINDNNFDDKGLVVGLHNSAMKVLKNADAIYDGQTEVSLVDGKIIGLTGKVLGSENNELKIVKGDREYTLKYMYVSRAIRNVNDLSTNRDMFPSTQWINPNDHQEGLSKYTPYIFEMDLASNSYDEGARVPTLKIDGYYVLADDIDVGSSIYSVVYGQEMERIITAIHSDYRPTAAFKERKDVGFIGTFDGRGHAISNITTWQGGLFGYINGGTIKNTAFINICNYWQQAQKNMFADFSVNAKFENLYVKLQQQGLDQGSGSYFEYWACLFSRGTIHVKDCVLESFILEGKEINNTNYVYFINAENGSTYQNVHCVGSSPLSITSVVYTDGVKLMVTEKEMQEIGAQYDEPIYYGSDITIWSKFKHVMMATEQSDVNFVRAPSGVEKYDTIAKFNNAMKNDQTAVSAFMETGCWEYDETTGALTWKNK